MLEWFASVAEWFQASHPRTWVSHALIWLSFQSVGGLLDWLSVLLGFSWRARLFQLVGYTSGLVFYGQREVAHSWTSLSAGDWVQLGDSVMDFLVPVLVNSLVLWWLSRKAAAEVEVGPGGDLAAS